MPRNLRLIARFANSGLVVALTFAAIGALSKGLVGAALLILAVAGLLGFNLYLIEKAAIALSEEEWLKGRIRVQKLRQELEHLVHRDGNPSESKQDVSATLGHHKD